MGKGEAFEILGNKYRINRIREKFVKNLENKKIEGIKVSNFALDEKIQKYFY